MKPRTLVAMVGAGASLQAGAPTTQALLNPIEAAVEAHGEIPELQIASLRAEVQRRYGSIDFERMIRYLEELPYEIREEQERATGRPIATSSQLVNVAMVLNYAMDALVDAFPGADSLTDSQRGALGQLRRFFQQLTAPSHSRRIVLATLNYDDFIDDAVDWVDGFVPFLDHNYAVFEPKVWFTEAECSESHLLMHLHGSLRYGFRPLEHLTLEQQLEMPWSECGRFNNVDEAMKVTRHHSPSGPVVDGRMLPPSPIITGQNKIAKMMFNRRPYLYYASTLTREIATADALLIVGYGFGDDHVNGWIDEYLRIKRDGPVALITRRTGRDLFGQSRTERYIAKMAGRPLGTPQLNSIYEQCNGGAPPIATHGQLGRLYLVATGMLMDAEVEQKLISHLSA